MKLLATLCLFVFGGVALAVDPIVEIDPIGKSANKQGEFYFELKGANLAAQLPIVKVSYKGKEVINYTASSNGNKGIITITDPEIPAGKAKVQLKVKLANNNTLESVEVEVDFKASSEEPDPSLPPVTTNTALPPSVN